MSASTRKTYQGKALNDLTIEIIKAAEVLLKYKPGTLTIVQGGYNRGGVAASAGTHDGGGALDLTASDYKKKVEVFRKLGCAAWYRAPIRGLWRAHVHLIVDGDGTASAGGRSQVYQYRNRRNGLANNGYDTEYRMAVFPRFVYGAVKQRWKATQNTQGYSQPTANSKYKKTGTSRKKGWTWGTPNVATVSVDGVQWLVTSSGTFYKRSDFVKYENISVTKESKVYVVTASPSLLGLSSPGSGNKQKVVAKKGAPITSVGYTKLSNGQVWVKNTAGNWFLKDYLKVQESAPESTSAPVKPSKLRVMAYNLPGTDKLPNGEKRVAKAAEIIKAAHPDIIGLNELQGIETSKGSASAFARSVLDSLGKDYGLLTPTSSFNENYVIYREAAVSVVKQYDDIKVYAKVGSKTVSGRHLTPVVFKSTGSGRKFVYGVTHLVNNDPAGAQAQSVIIGTALKTISKENGNAPVIVSGDMNIAAEPVGFVSTGLVDTRTKTKASTGSKYATYTHIDQTRPSKDTAKWLIDQVWVSSNLTVNGYTVIVDTNVLGYFKGPRPSDHHPIVVSITI